jgi:hypothetical protein
MRIEENGEIEDKERWPISSSLYKGVYRLIKVSNNIR